jgi:methyltransferase-like protein/2-polyprenyl-3-methyl-5-hydroxy-6-metoxy-1,4-benzoquinol methylase
MHVPSLSPYDRIAYRTLPMPQTHPDRLATIALLHGMTPRPIDRCRVLELGCGDGSNLIPMAYGLPGSEFVGVDLAATAVGSGIATISALGLRNVVLHHLDIMEKSATVGTFDYIIAPGIYSWVPSPVRDRILAICQAHLAPQGVAFVSYNTYPGCHLRQAVWQILQFHVEGVTDPGERIAQARALARFMAECPQADASDGAVLGNEMRAVLDHSPGLLFHDDLAATNFPLYFHEFASHARRHRLQFLAEANFHEMQPQAYPPEVARQVWRLANESVVQKEQYLDFLRNRRFRQTLLCREDVTLDRALQREIVRTLYLGASARPVAERPNVDDPGIVEEFRGRGDSTMSTDHPLAKAAMLHLGQAWPRVIGFDELLRNIGRRGVNAAEVGSLLDILLAAYTAGLIELHTHAPHFALEPGPRPTASPVARLQLEHGSFVASLRHTSVCIEDDLGRRLLQLMDGTRTSEMLRHELAGYLSTQPSPVEVSAAVVDRKVVEAASLALLIA